MLMLLYNFVYYIVRLSLPLFFSDIVVLGRSNVPKKGPLILIGNHPNMLLDGLVLGVTCDRYLSIWAKSSLFKGITGKIFRQLGCIPVKRKMDQKDGSAQKERVDNSELQQETFKALTSGKCLCLFPEGTSHSEAHILHLKDGLAWMIFEFYDSTDGKINIPIQPCGIVYTNKHRWRSQVVVQYGKPFHLSNERLVEYRKDKKAAVKKLTSDLEEILYNLTLNSPDWETMKLVHTARRIYMDDTKLSLAEYVEVTRRFASVYEKSKENPDMKQIREDLANYQKKLDSLHLKDSHVRSQFTLWNALETVIERLVYVIVLLPLAVSGFLVNAPIIVIGKLSNLLTPYQEAKATFKLLIALILVPFIYVLYSYAVSWFFDVSFYIVFSVVCSFGLAHVRIMEEEKAVLQSIVSSLRIVSVIVRNTQRQELKELKKTRSELAERITKLVETYASPEQRKLDVGPSVSLGATRRFLPTLVRTTSHSDVYL